MQDLERVLNRCDSFLTLPENYIYPIHQSAKDYIASDVAVDGVFQSGIPAVQCTIFERSIAVMENTLKRDMYHLVHPGTLIVEEREWFQDHQLHKVEYSYVY